MLILTFVRRPGIVPTIADAHSVAQRGEAIRAEAMTRTNAGKLDRRVIVEIATETQDAAGDVTVTWAVAFKRWAIRVDGRGREFFGAQQIVRDADTAFEVRDDSQSRSIAAETYRIVDHDKVFEIVGITEGRERADTLILLCAYRPDLRGAKAPIDAEE
jgi:head-tail adaptor